MIWSQSVTFSCTSSKDLCLGKDLQARIRMTNMIALRRRKFKLQLNKLQGMLQKSFQSICNTQEISTLKKSLTITTWDSSSARCSREAAIRTTEPSTGFLRKRATQHNWDNSRCKRRGKHRSQEGFLHRLKQLSALLVWPVPEHPLRIFRTCRKSENRLEQIWGHRSSLATVTQQEEDSMAVPSKPPRKGLPMSLLMRLSTQKEVTICKLLNLNITYSLRFELWSNLKFVN